MSQPIEPKHHTSGSKFVATVGEGANQGFRWGVLGVLAGFALIPAAAAGAAFALGATGGVIAAVAIGASVVSALAGIPAMAIGGAIGGVLGFSKGARQANQRTSQEQQVARYQEAYAQTQMQIQNAMLAQVAEAQAAPYQAAQSQVRAEMDAMPPQIAANDNQFNQASSKIDGSTIQHEKTIAANSVEHARG